LSYHRYDASTGASKAVSKLLGHSVDLDDGRQLLQRLRHLSAGGDAELDPGGGTFRGFDSAKRINSDLQGFPLSLAENELFALPGSCA
jgi:hypothetical protein